MSRWRHLTRDEMGGYDFEMYEKSVGSRWAHINYDFGGWSHPSGDEMTMDNIDEFVQDYPAGYYWSGGVRSPGSKTVYGGPFKTRHAAQDEANAFLRGEPVVACA